MAGFDKKVYDQQYKKDKFDNFSFYAPKGTKDKAKKLASKKGMVLSEYLRYLIDKAYEEDAE